MVCVGDLNIYHRPWLFYSNRDSREGELMHDFCCAHNFRQHVSKSTRGKYLLDVCVSDLDGIKIEHLPGLADHQSLLMTVTLDVPPANTSSRTEWDWKHAKWNKLKADLVAVDWSFVDHLDLAQQPSSSQLLFNMRWQRISRRRQF